MEIGDRIEVIAGVFKGELGTIWRVDDYDTYLIHFDKPPARNEIHFTGSEIRLYEGNQSTRLQSSPN